MDRRIQKTKLTIMNVLIELMSKKNFEKITINDIANHANINRGTVYLHYVDKYDLLDKCTEYYLLQLVNYCSSSNNHSIKNSLLCTFEYLENNAFLYKTLLTSKSVPMFREKLTKILLRALEYQIDINLDKITIPKDIQMQFLASAIFGVLEWWLTNPTSYSSEKVTEYLCILFERNNI